MITLPTPSNLEELPRHPLPTMYDLPSENPEDPGLPDEFHSFQPMLLLLTFHPLNWDPEMVYSVFNHYIYYDGNHPLWYKRPDWYGVVGVPRRYQGRDMRLSYVMWQEKISPLIVVELLSPGTEDEDLGRTRSTGGQPTKWQVYEQIMRVPYYVIYSRYTEELQVFRLEKNRYQMVALTQERLWIPEIQLSLGLWEGEFMGHNRLWLRWMTQSGDLITSTMDAATKAAIEQEKQEIAEAERQIVEAQQRTVAAEEETAAALQRAAEAQQQIEELKALLRERGFDPDDRQA